MPRRDELLAQATDYVLSHGLIGLSLRPLAEAVGTSDRMLLYHFKSKDHLVTAILRESNDRSLAYLANVPPADGLRAAVGALWQATTSRQIAPCTRMYVEAAALGVLGEEPYASAVRAFNDEWIAGISAYLAASGVPEGSATRVAVLIDYAFLGLTLDQELESAEQQKAAVEDLATALDLLVRGA